MILQREVDGYWLQIDVNGHALDLPPNNLDVFAPFPKEDYLVYHTPPTRPVNSFSSSALSKKFSVGEVWHLVYHIILIGGFRPFNSTG